MLQLTNFTNLQIIPRVTRAEKIIIFSKKKIHFRDSDLYLSIYISGRNSIFSYNRKKHNFQYTRTTNLPYQLLSLLSKKKKKSSFKSSIYFNSFPPIIPFYRGLNGKPIVSVGGARIEGKREREKKRGRRRIETESETMYIQAVHSRSKRLTTEERNVGQSGKINHRIEQEETEKIKRSKLGWKIVVYIYIYIIVALAIFLLFILPVYIPLWKMGETQ